MRVGYRWLKFLVDVSAEPYALARDLTMRGVVVDEVVNVTSPAKDIVVAQVVDVARHPQADRLSLCQVSTGRATYRVVCGAPNVKAGARYPFALVGSVLPDGTKIKKAKIRGESSEGMLLSGWELGISDDHEGLLDLGEGPGIGSPIESVLDFDDHAFLLDVTANRMDLLSHLGVAREIAALTGKSVMLPRAEIAEGGREIGSAAAIEVSDSEGCPRYMARVIEGVRVGPSPQWLVRRLASVDQRSINNIVDVTNYVLLELGTPLHAFDLDRLAGRKIIVRRAREGERMTTLDGIERILSPEMTMIADAEKSVAIGGVMGGAESEVSDATVNVFIECAHFNPPRIRRTSRALGLLTEASARFERWVDPSILPYAVDRAAELMQKVAGGTILRGRADVYPAPHAPLTVRMRRERVRKILGQDVRDEEMPRLLESVGFRVSAEEDLLVEVPLFRARDVTREIDLIEEIARLKGYDAVETRYICGVKVFGKVDHRGRFERRLREFMRGEGFFEAMSTSFTGERIASSLLQVPESRMARVNNPVNEEEPYLRPLLLATLLPVVAGNVRKRNRDVRIFEYGTVFEKAGTRGEKPRESWHIAALATGAREPVSWRGGGAPWDFYSFKGVVERLLARHRPGARFVEQGPRFLLEHGSRRITDGQREVGFMGEAAPAVRAQLDIESPLFVLELEIDEAIARGKGEQPAPSRFPPLERDLSLIVPEDIRYEQVEEAIRRKGGGLLADLVLFDVYRGGQIPSGRRGLSFRLVFRSPERTLEDEEVNGIIEETLDYLRKELKIGLR